MDNFQNQRVTVMGLGLYKEGSGIEAVKFFLRQGARVTVTDARSASDLAESVKEATNYWLALQRRAKSVERRARNPKPLALSSKLVFILGKHREEDFKNADIVFQNPSVPADSPYLRLAEKRNIPIVNDWSLFLSRHTPKLFVGITGTRGKSTTTALIYEMMKMKYTPSSPPPSRGRKRSDVPLPRWEGLGEGDKVRLAGNLGVSPLAFIDTYRGEPIVAELSSWLLHHFPTVKKSPNVAVVTNILNDHMDKYRSMREYIEDKENIFRFQTGRQGLRSSGGLASEYVVLNADDPVVRKMARKARGRVVWFSAKSSVHSSQFTVNLPGEHNVANVNAAMAVAKVLGIGQQYIEHVLKTFQGLPGRLELVRTVNGVAYYNDTTATTPEATIAGLRTLGTSSQKLGARSKHVVLICGGADKKLEYRDMTRYVKQYCKAVVLLPGSATEKMRRQFTVHSSQFTVRSMKEAVKKAHSLAQDGDIVLLSPAAASFGLFKNEFDRGAQFVTAVKKIA